MKSNEEEFETARAKTSEACPKHPEYETILDAAPFGIVLFGSDRIVQRCNSEYERIIGVAPGELLGQQAPLPEDQRDAWRDLEDVLRAGHRIVGHEVMRLRRDGSRFSATIWITPLQNCCGSNLGLLGFILDNTEHNARLETALIENLKLLEENRLLQEKQQRENISLQERNLSLQSEVAEIQRVRFEKIIGESPAIRRILNKVDQVAATDVTVLITGETGTGKELIAQAIHENSKRARMSFRAINCAALPTTLMAAELFGHEKGAFTGAERLRMGQFELASGGTLFLDEIAEIPIEMQAMLLRVLEEHSFERLGGTKLVVSDARIIAATNRDLHAAMQKGEFREDLFFRLNNFPIDVPPLRERKDDIPQLVWHFIQVSSARHRKNIQKLEKRAMEMLRAYSWPGNIRELRNVIDTFVIISPGEELVIDEAILRDAPTDRDAGVGTLEERLAKYECGLIERALVRTRGRLSGASGAATILGIPPSTLSARMKTLRIDASRFKLQADGNCS